MQNVRKIAISLPKDDFKEIEKVCARMGIGRSAVIGRAIRFWLQQREKAQMIKCYEDGYKRKPERVFDLESFEKAELEVLDAKEDWS